LDQPFSLPNTPSLNISCPPLYPFLRLSLPLVIFPHWNPEKLSFVNPPFPFPSITGSPPQFYRLGFPFFRAVPLFLFFLSPFPPVSNSVPSMVCDPLIFLFPRDLPVWRNPVDNAPHVRFTLSLWVDGRYFSIAQAMSLSNPPFVPHYAAKTNPFVIPTLLIFILAPPLQSLSHSHHFLRVHHRPCNLFFCSCLVF